MSMGRVMVRAISVRVWYNRCGRSGLMSGFGTTDAESRG